MIEKDKILYVRVVNFDKNVVQKTKEALSKNRDIKGKI